MLVNFLLNPNISWYEYILYGSILLMVFQFILSVLFGDMDIDVDIDLSDVISFKGAIHFLLGFSLVLTANGNDDVISLFFGVITGLVFLIGLHYVYYWIYKNLKQEIKYQEVINNQDAEVYYWVQHKNMGEVFVVLEGRKITVDITGDYKLSAGDKIKVSGTRNLVHISI